jgi:4-hydroxybenzoate polyprenyltransferase
MGEATVTGPPSNLFTAVVKAVRPRQWVKNLLVFAAPLAALGGPDTYDYRTVLGRVSVAFVVFCMAASSIYLVNDARDVEADRAHPTKRFRPIAAGVLPVGIAYGIAAALAAGCLAISWWLTPQLAAVMAVYLVIQLAYCFGLKHQAVLDISILSSGFLIRAIAGGVAGGIPLSQWFLLVMAFGSLFMAAGKRFAEVAGELHQHLPDVRVDTVGDRGRALLRVVGLRTRRQPPVLVRHLDDPVHRGDPALRGGRRRRPGRRAGGDRPARPGAAAAGPGLDRNRHCRRTPHLARRPPPRFPTGSPGPDG